MLRLDAQPRETPAGTEIVLTGLCGSAVVIDRVESTMEGETLVVRVYGMLTRQDHEQTGTLDHVVRVPPGVQRVVIGEEGHVLWSRTP